MNSQKIQDHAEHCDFYVGNEHWDKSYEEQQRLWVEKFAELIIEECIDKISQEQDIAEQNWQCKNGVHICHELTKYFGFKP